MKLSNKILIGFLGIIFLYLTAAFAEVRLRGTPNFIDSKNSVAETVELSVGITHLILKNMDSRNVKVIGADRARLHVRSYAGNALKKLTHKVSGDTLTLSGFDGEDERVQISVFVRESDLKGISVTSATATIEGLRQPRLRISENAGRVWMTDNRIGKIELDLSNKSFADITVPKLDTISLNMDASQMYISSPVGLIQGSMENNSFLQLSEIREIQLKKDANSNLKMY